MWCTFFRSLGWIVWRTTPNHLGYGGAISLLLLYWHHPEANNIMTRRHRSFKTVITSDNNWTQRLSMILLGLQARPHSPLEPRSSNLPISQARRQRSRMMLSSTRNPRVVQQYDGEASAALQAADFVLVR